MKQRENVDGEKIETLNVLGTEYRIEKKEFGNDPLFEEKNIDGYCEGVLKKIVYCDMIMRPNLIDDSEEYCKEVEKQILRHEIVHAFLNESGLMENASRFCGAWSRNEEMVDWIALQFPKMLKAFEEADCI